MNLFEQAILKNELLNFALGKDEYFIADRDYGDHSVMMSWTNNVLPLIDTKGIVYINSKIKEMLLELLESNIDGLVKNECLLYHLHVYYYLNSEGRIKADSLISFDHRILKSLNDYVLSLQKTNQAKANAITHAINLIQSRGGLVP